MPSLPVPPALPKPSQAAAAMHAKQALPSQQQTPLLLPAPSRQGAKQPTSATTRILRRHAPRLPTKPALPAQNPAIWMLPTAATTSKRQQPSLPARAAIHTAARLQHSLSQCAHIHQFPSAMDRPAQHAAATAARRRNSLLPALTAIRQNSAASHSRNALHINAKRLLHSLQPAQHRAVNIGTPQALHQQENTKARLPTEADAAAEAAIMEAAAAVEAAAAEVAAKHAHQEDRPPIFAKNRLSIFNV